MAGSSALLGSQASPDHPFVHQLQLQEPTTSPALLPSRSKRPQLLVSCSLPKRFLESGSNISYVAFDKEHHHDRTKTAQGAALLTCKSPTDKRHSIDSTILASKHVLDYLDDIEDASLDGNTNWPDEILSSFQRSLLESQWALQSAQGLTEERESLDVEIPNISHVASDRIRSGKASARKRRLDMRSRVNSACPCNAERLSGSVLPLTVQGKKKKGRVKVDPVHDFVTSFLKPTTRREILTKDEEQGLTKHMRRFQSLEKAKRKLEKELGYEPPYELWAHSVQLSTGELLSAINKGEDARNKMLVSHLRLVVSIARHYQNLGMDMADLIQEGSRGLLRGLEKFDHRKGYKMSTYVHWWIRQGITRAIADHSRTLRIPVYLHEIIFAMRRAKTSLIEQGKPVTVESLSSFMKVPSYRIQRALQAKNGITSLDKTSTSYGFKMELKGLHEYVADHHERTRPWDLVDVEETKNEIRKRLSLLTSKEQEVIRWTFGIDTRGGAQATLASLGEKFGVSKERVRQIKFYSLKKMRSNMPLEDVEMAWD